MSEIEQQSADKAAFTAALKQAGAHRLAEMVKDITRRTTEQAARFAQVTHVESQKLNRPFTR